ncbi:MAG: threonine/serine dehydratase [Actinomycetota bacterium]
MPELVSLDEIRAAAARLEGVTLRTPLIPFPGSDLLLLKPESLQPTGSFKIRGAYTAISALPDDARRRGVVAHSSGNHAAAVAYAAGLLGVPAAVVVPASTPPVKIVAARAFGAEVVICEPGLPARLAACDKLIAQHGYTMIPPFDHRAVISGQGTIGLEIGTDRPDVDVVLSPVSGGGLVSGIAAAIHALCPGAAVIGVEPEHAADARDSFRQRQQVTWPVAETSRTLADALRVEQIGKLPLAHMLAYVHDIVTVTDGELRVTMRRLALETRLVTEPGGVAAVAACLFHASELPPGRVRVAVVSGGNVDPALLADVLTDDGAPASASE